MTPIQNRSGWTIDMTYRECYEAGRAMLEKAGVEEAALDARLLLEYVCGTNRNDLLAHGERSVEKEKEDCYGALLSQRVLRVPLQHLTGVQEFMGLEFSVNEHVLIPRQDTEILVEEVLRDLQDGMEILDMCTGSGCILISLLHYSNHCKGVGVDLSEQALAVAETNAGRLLQDFEEKLTLLQSDLFEKVTGKYDVIVSNPPYIVRDVLASLMPEVAQHEPRMALDGGEDGLDFYRRIAEESGAYLREEGRLYLEIGYDQGEAVSALLQEAGFADVRVVKDYAGQDRVVCGIFER